jgi:hypothetical protein
MVMKITKSDLQKIIKAEVKKEIAKADLKALDSNQLKQFERQILSKYPQLERFKLYDYGIYMNKPCVRLDSIIIKKEFRGKGFGSSVIRELQKFIKDNLCILVVSPGAYSGKSSETKKIILMYKKLGFKKGGPGIGDFYFV